MKVSYPAFSASMAPVLIGIEKGYYAEEGLDIQMVNAGGGASTPSLIAGEVPYTTSAGSAISAIINGAPLKVIYTTEDRPGYELWAVPPDIKTVADIKGKTVGIQTRGDTNEIAMNLFLRSQGMPVNSVIYAAMGSEQNKLAAMQNGSVPLALIGASTAHQYQTSGGTGHLLVDLKKEVHMVYTGLATSDKELAQNRDRAKRFLRATIKGRIYWKMFKEETIQILGKYNHLSHDANELDYDDDYPALTADGTVSADIQQADTAVRAQIIGVNPPPTDKIYDYSVLQEVNRELQASGWQPQR
ncbi:MAG TPA: ABC transporter substrate-binding protein [Chloroflexota bacterium]|nr:ABC transporter substrate-binding protein [Chloroflexota bacterium]